MPKFITKEEQSKLEKIHIEHHLKWKSDTHDSFIIFPEKLLFHDDFSDGEIRFYQKLFALSDKAKGDLYHSNAKLAEICNCSDNNIKKYLKNLKKKKAIEVYSTGIHNKRIICLTPWNITK